MNLARTMATGDWIMDRDLERYFDSEEPELSTTDIEQQVKTVIAEQFNVNVGEVDLAADLVKHYGSDSLDLVEVTMGIEDQFGLEIDDDAMWKMKTGQQIVDYVKEHATA